MKPRLAGAADTAARSDRRISRKSLVLVVAMLGTLGGVGATVGIASPAAATTNSLYVSNFGSDSGNCTSSGSPCAAVSYAVEQASSGDTVYVSGTIHDSVTVETLLSIAQWPGESSAVLDGQGLNAVLLVFGVDVSLDGITLTDGGGSEGEGGAVDNYGGSLTIEGSSIWDSTARARLEHGQRLGRRNLGARWLPHDLRLHDLGRHDRVR